MGHPCRFTPAILDALAEWITRIGLPVHDPFAGTGERLGALCDQLGVKFTGIEIEPPYIVDPRVKAGNAKHYWSYPFGEFMVVTSPVYPNGMTDHFHAKDNSKRHTYRQGKAAILGYDEPLHEDNMGRYGNRYRRSKKSEERHFEIARQCIVHWPEWAIVNVKDVVARDYSVYVTLTWQRMLEEAGYEIVDTTHVETPGQRHGANADLRDPGENILVARRRR